MNRASGPGYRLHTLPQSPTAVNSSPPRHTATKRQTEDGTSDDNKGEREKAIASPLTSEPQLREATHTLTHTWWNTSTPTLSPADSGRGVCSLPVLSGGSTPRVKESGSETEEALTTREHHPADKLSGIADFLEEMLLARRRRPHTT